MIRSTEARLFLTALAMIAAYVPSSAQTTHEFQATEYYNTFSFAHPPALRIRPGDRVVTRTIDAGGQDLNGDQVAQGPNPQIGPFYVVGAEPGDVLVVRLEKIEPNRDWAYSNSVLAPYAADPSYLRYEAEHEDFFTQSLLSST